MHLSRQQETRQVIYVTMIAFKIHYVSLATREGAKEQRGLKKEGGKDGWLKEMRIRWNE